jgi:ABC-type enterochelin transport system substrate-binding protein
MDRDTSVSQEAYVVINNEYLKKANALVSGSIPVSDYPYFSGVLAGMRASLEILGQYIKREDV